MRKTLPLLLVLALGTACTDVPAETDAALGPSGTGDVSTLPPVVGDGGVTLGDRNLGPGPSGDGGPGGGGGSVGPPCLPAQEVCDALDNDCNGQVDDGDPGGGAVCATGLSGNCGPGVLHCLGGEVVCDPINDPRAEVCNGADDDCDGMADDNVPGAGDACDGGEGICDNAVMACVLGQLVCRPVLVPGDEVCNGADDNCDGVVDEGNPGGGASCGTATGACETGVLTCSGGAFVCTGSHTAGCSAGASAT